MVISPKKKIIIIIIKEYKNEKDTRKTISFIADLLELY